MIKSNLDLCHDSCPHISNHLRYVGINNRCTLFDEEIEFNREDYNQNSVAGLNKYKPYYRCNKCNLEMPS